MSQMSNSQWKKGQDVEVYDPSQRRWITGNIHDIRDDKDKKIYCIEHQEYSKEILHKDAHSLMRIPQINQQFDDIDADETFASSYRKIAPKFPISRQMEIWSKDIDKFNIKSMISVH